MKQHRINHKPEPADPGMVLEIVLAVAVSVGVVVSTLQGFGALF